MTAQKVQRRAFCYNGEKQEAKMNVARLELCKKLYTLSGWKETDNFYQFIEYSDLSTGYYLTNPTVAAPLHANAYPAYDLGYLLRRLPPLGYKDDGRMADSWLTLELAGGKWFCGHKGWGDGAEANTPEDAACKLAIALFQQGILK